MINQSLNVAKVHFNSGRFTPYSMELASMAVVWFFWSLWSVGEVVEGRLRFLEILRTISTGLFFIKPEIYGEKVQLPEILALPFLLSAFISVILRLTRTKIKSD